MILPEVLLEKPLKELWLHFFSLISNILTVVSITCNILTVVYNILTIVSITCRDAK